MEIKEIYQIMFEAVKHRSIEALFEGAYKIFKLPIAASDASFNMLAPNYPPLPQGDDAWDRPLREKKVPYDIVRMFQDDGVIHRVHQNPHETIYLNWGNFTEMPRLTTSINVNDNVEGYLAVYCPREKLQEWHFPALQVVADAFGILLQKQSTDTNVVRRSFFRDLFAGEISSARELQKWLDICNLQLTGDYILLVATPRERKKMTSLRYVGSCIDGARLPVLISQNDEKLLLLLYEQNINSQRGDAALPELLQLIESFDMFCGMSRSFDSLLQANDYLQQAQSSLMLGRQLSTCQHIFPYEQFSLAVILDTIYSQLPLSSSIHPILLKLRDFDKENQSNYFETLQVHLMSMHNTAKTCEQLNIHRNTLMYRLRRIEEICNCDLQQNSLDVHLIISFKLWERFHGKTTNVEKEISAVRTII